MRAAMKPLGRAMYVASQSDKDWIQDVQRKLYTRSNRAFLVAYAAARAGWHEGATVVFPTGTYWLRRFANVPTAAA